MKKILLTLLTLLISVSYSYADKCYSPDSSPLILESDKKTGKGRKKSGQ